MTYEEFKKELYRNLSGQEMACEKQVILLEKGKVFANEDVVTMIRMINFGDRGREETVVREDIVCVLWKRQGIGNMFHWRIRPLYERYKKEGWQGVLPKMVAKLQRLGRTGDYFPTGEYACESERLIIRPLHYPYHREELENSVYWQFGDIALVLYIMVYGGAEDNLTVKMNRDMVGKWDVTEEGILTNALLNTYVRMPPRLYYGTDIGFQYEQEWGVFMPGETGKKIAVHPDDEQEGIHGYRLTTIGWRYGAVALFYPGVKERLAELLDGDYYVGFTSIHEAMLYPARYKVLREMKVAIQHTNIMFDSREMLTNRVYRYSCSRRELIEV